MTPVAVQQVRLAADGTIQLVEDLPALHSPELEQPPVALMQEEQRQSPELAPVQRVRLAADGTIELDEGERHALPSPEEPLPKEKPLMIGYYGADGKQHDITVTRRTGPPPRCRPGRGRPGTPCTRSASAAATLTYSKWAATRCTYSRAPGACSTMGSACQKMWRTY